MKKQEEIETLMRGLKILHDESADKDLYAMCQHCLAWTLSKPNGFDRLFKTAYNLAGVATLNTHLRSRLKPRSN